MIIRSLFLATTTTLAIASSIQVNHATSQKNIFKKSPLQKVAETAYGACATVVGTVLASNALSAICDQIGNLGRRYLELRQAYNQNKTDLATLDQEKVLSAGEIKFWSIIKAGSKTPSICAQEAISLGALLCIFYLSAKAVYSGVKLLAGSDEENRTPSIKKEKNRKHAILCQN